MLHRKRKHSNVTEITQFQLRYVKNYATSDVCKTKLTGCNIFFNKDTLIFPIITGMPQNDFHEGPYFHVFWLIVTEFTDWSLCQIDWIQFLFNCWFQSFSLTTGSVQKIFTCHLTGKTFIYLFRFFYTWVKKWGNTKRIFPKKPSHNSVTSSKIGKLQNHVKRLEYFMSLPNIFLV